MEPVKFNKIIFEISLGDCEWTRSVALLNGLFSD